MQDAAQTAFWRRRSLRLALSAVAALVVVLAGAIAFSLATIDTDDLKPRIAEAVKRATGRALKLNGPIYLKLSLAPRVQAVDVSFANPPGFSRPMMATLQRLELQLALLPLLSHRVEVEHLALIGADVLLETNATGETNWVFPRKPHPTADDEPGHIRLSITDAEIDGGTLAYFDARSGRGAVLGVAQLTVHADSLNAPLQIAMQASANDGAFSLAGDVGPLGALQNPKFETPWPVRLRLAEGATTLTIDGSIGHLAKARLYDLQLTGSAPDIAPLAPILPGVSLPPLRDVSLSAHLLDTGRHVEFDATLRSASASLAAKGVIGDLTQLAGVDVAFRAEMTDLTDFSAWAGQKLPQLQLADFEARLTDGSGGLKHGLTLRDIKFTSNQAELAGEAVADYDARPSLRAKLHAARIDAGALLVAGAAEPSLPARPATTSAVIPNDTLPFDLLRMADADIDITIDSLRSRKAEYRSLAARLALHDRLLRIVPFTADLPAGRLVGTLSADATLPTPRIDLTLHAPGLQVQQLLAALGLTQEVAGKMRVSLELHSTGDTLRAIAAGLNGHLGLAMAGGTVSNWLLANTAGWALREAGMPDLATAIGSSHLRCFALRMDLKDGVGDLDALLLDSSILYLDGSGTIDLNNETIDLSLRPEPKMGGVGLSVPLNVSGTLANPSVGDPIAATTTGIFIGAVGLVAAPFDWIAETLGLIEPRARARDICISPLIQARATEASLQPLPPVQLLH